MTTTPIDPRKSQRLEFPPCKYCGVPPSFREWINGLHSLCGNRPY